MMALMVIPSQMTPQLMTPHTMIMSLSVLMMQQQQMPAM